MPRPRDARHPGACDDRSPLRRRARCSPDRARAPRPRARAGPTPRVHTSATLERHRLLQRLGELQEELVERDGAGETAPEGPDHLVGRVAFPVDAAGGELGESLADGDPRQRRHRGREHRQTEQGLLLAGRRAAEAEHDEEIRGRDHRRRDPAIVMVCTSNRSMRTAIRSDAPSASDTGTQHRRAQDDGTDRLGPGRPARAAPTWSPRSRRRPPPPTPATGAGRAPARSGQPRTGTRSRRARSPPHRPRARGPATRPRAGARRARHMRHREARDVAGGSREPACPRAQATVGESRARGGARHRAGAPRQPRACPRRSRARCRWRRRVLPARRRAGARRRRTRQTPSPRRAAPAAGARRRTPMPRPTRRRARRRAPGRARGAPGHRRVRRWPRRRLRWPRARSRPSRVLTTADARGTSSRMLASSGGWMPSRPRCHGHSDRRTAAGQRARGGPGGHGCDEVDREQHRGDGHEYRDERPGRDRSPRRARRPPGPTGTDRPRAPSGMPRVSPTPATMVAVPGDGGAHLPAIEAEGLQDCEVTTATPHRDDQREADRDQRDHGDERRQRDREPVDPADPVDLDGDGRGQRGAGRPADRPERGRSLRAIDARREADDEVPTTVGVAQPGEARRGEDGGVRQGRRVRETRAPRSGRRSGRSTSGRDR